MQTIGQRLKAAREEKRLPLEKVFEATRIRVQYLQALEDDDLSSMPSPVQARGYLRNYAEFLGLNFDQLLEEVRSEKQAEDVIIGPADLTVEKTEQAPVPPPVEAETPLSKTEPASIIETESSPEPPLVKPKRRGRKKAEPETQQAPVVEPQPETVEEPEAVIEAVVEVQPETTTASQPDLSDNLWQSWLNRLSSVITSRKKQAATAQDEVEERAIPEPPFEEIPAKEDSSREETSGSQKLESTEIFKEIGAELRIRRETLSLNLEEVERSIRVKAHYLDALEQGAMERLPSTVQTRGMLSNYAAFLDLDVDVLLLRFADGLQARHREKNPQKPARKPGQPILANLPVVRTFIAGDMIFGIGMAVLLVGFAIWGINRVATLQSLRDIQPTAPPISEILLATPDPDGFTATPTLLPVESIPGEATATIVIPTVNVNVRVQVNFVAVERTYMRVVADGRTVFDGRVTPGSAYPFEAENQIEVLVGSGAGVRVVYNGRDLGLLGSFGEVVSYVYTATDILTPTALPTATFTITSTPTSTVPPSATPRPTNTPIPTRTPLP